LSPAHAIAIGAAVGAFVLGGAFGIATIAATVMPSLAKIGDALRGAGGWWLGDADA
jgi:hypothetical protein